ncbi:V-type ATP synthase subunit A [Actinocatenispora thailandica]|uniref:V-type ATP synthase subunit A n=1 Tax=Actinocatenispora thailandica TaxID=227318 RepID=UPI0031D76FBF
MAGVIRRVAGPLVDFDVADAGTAVGDLVSLGAAGVPGEVVSIAAGRATTQAYEYTGGLAPGQPARPRGAPLSAALGPHLLGGVFDGLLRPLSGAPDFLEPGAGTAVDTVPRRFTPRVRAGDVLAAGAVLGVLDTGPVEYRVLVPPGGGGTVQMVAAAGLLPPDAVLARVGDADVRQRSAWPVRRPRPHAGRLGTGRLLRTGQRVVDQFFPLPVGGTAGVPGGFGTGKTLLLQQIAKWCDADVVVYVGCGERGNEMAEVVADLTGLTDPRTGGRLADRTVIIANTSNMPMMAREASVYTGVTVAEHFRDMGLDAVVIADSTSRWAEALREFAARTGELPAEEGYPAGLPSALAAFYERAGAVRTLGGDTGSVTIIGAVSPPGGDLTEPVTTYTERFVRCRWTLDRDLAYSRHYPAVSWSESFCRDLGAAAAAHRAAGDAGWPDRRDRILAVLAEADRLTTVAELVGVDALPPAERAALLCGRLARDALLRQSALSAVDAYCDERRGAALAEAVRTVCDAVRAAVAGAAVAADVERVDFGPLVRAREDPDTDGVAGRVATVLAAVRGAAP